MPHELCAALDDSTYGFLIDPYHGGTRSPRIIIGSQEMTTSVAAEVIAADPKSHLFNERPHLGLDRISETEVTDRRWSPLGPDEREGDTMSR